MTLLPPPSRPFPPDKYRLAVRSVCLAPVAHCCDAAVSSRDQTYWDRYYPFAAVGSAAGRSLLSRRTAGGAATVGHTLGEFFSFITLIGSLFVVAGGIHLKTKGEALPWQTSCFSRLRGHANLIGTPGLHGVYPAVDPANKIRASAYHVVFFIFVVANVGGALTPWAIPRCSSAICAACRSSGWSSSHGPVAGHDGGNPWRFLDFRPPQFQAHAGQTAA